MEPESKVCLQDWKSDSDPDMAEVVIKENMIAVKTAVLFLLQNKLKTRKFNDKVKLTWTKV